VKENLLIEIASPIYYDFPESGGGNDLLLFLRTAARYEKVAYVDKPLVYFGSPSDSITASRRYRDLFNRYHQVRVNFALESGTEKVVRRVVAQAWIQNCIYQRRLLPPGVVSRLFVRKGVVLQPSDMAWAVLNEMRRWRHYKGRLWARKR